VLLLLLYLFLALFFSFSCSIMEAVLLSVPAPFLRTQIDAGEVWAAAFGRLKQDIDRPLSAILSLNTIAHTIGAAGVGAQSVAVFGEAWFGVVSAVLTLLILVITEIIPKTLGARYWRRLAPLATRMIGATIWLMYPLVLLSALITRALARDAGEERTTSREEISALASIGSEEGLFDDREHRIIQNLLRLRDVRAEAVMTPRVVMAAADENLSLDAFRDIAEYRPFSRIPVYDGHRENITGYIFRQDVLERLADGQRNLCLRDLRRRALMLPVSIALFGAWEQLLASREQLAVVVDEYGGIEGLLTMEDVIETLLGLEILDERDTVSDMQAYARELWERRQSD
jgi:CBS domain containing-hemolysin-like protein